MKLYNYFRSSASYRVRMALELKGLDYDYVPVHLVRREQLAPAYAAVSPQQLVPALEVDGQVLTQSMAIIEFLDETHPQPPLLPADPWGRARVRALAQAVACEVHPLNNLRVLAYLVHDMEMDDTAKNQWYHHWVRTGLEGLEGMLAQDSARRETAGLPASRFCFGDSPTLADCCLVPQIFNAQRFQVDLAGLPRTMAAFDACMALPAVQRAHPSQCPDATP